MEMPKKVASDATSLNGNEINPSNEDKRFWALSQAELISRLVESRSKINYLEDLCHKLVDSKVSSVQVLSSSSKKIIQPNNNNEKELVEDQPLRVLESFPLIQSPYVTTPPYEYIVLTEENEKRFRIFVNPKVDQVFREELLKNKINKEEDHLDTFREIILPLPHTSSDATIIHCFDPSEVDVELKKIFKKDPPATLKKIIRRKSRLERNSSVPAIDSYYGTQDLDMVGHASYFIPDLSPSERKTIGWKDRYTYGRWKYSSNSSPSDTVSSSVPPGGKSFFSKASIKNLVRKSRSSRTHIITTSAATARKLSEESAKDCPPFSPKVKTSSPKKPRKSIISFVSNNTAIDGDESQKNGRRVLLKCLKKWLVPCYYKNKGIEETPSCCSSETCCPILIENNSEGNKKGEVIPHVHTHHRHDHHKDKMILGCFHYKTGRKTEVVGGDFLVSADDSLVSMIYEYSRRSKDDLEESNLEQLPKILVPEEANKEIQLLQIPEEKKQKKKKKKKVFEQLSENNYNKSSNFNYEDNNVDASSEIQSSVQSPPSMQVSFYTIPDLEEAEEEFVEDSSKNSNKVHQGCQEDSDFFETIPETRFLDPKDLDLSKYKMKSFINFVDEEYEEFEEEFEDEYGEEEEDLFTEEDYASLCALIDNNNEEFEELGKSTEGCEAATTMNIKGKKPDCKVS